MKAALRLFGLELNEDELQSLDLFKSRFNDIYQSVVQKNKDNVTINSLETYKSRLQRLISDYEKFGIDPSKMANWNPPHRVRIKKEKVKQIIVSHSVPLVEENPTPNTMNTAELTSFRPSKNIFISYPLNFTLEEAKSIKSFADYLISMRGGDQTREK